jgi:hypothetical protein
MWTKRYAAPFNALQVAYHETQSCDWPYIHLEKKDLRGKVHYCIENTAKEKVVRWLDDIEGCSSILGASPPVYWNP